MSPRQSKFSIAMIELCTLPLLSRVTDRAILREPGSPMVWVRGFVVVRLMTGKTVHGRSRKPPSNMAFGATYLQMGPGQGKSRLAVIILRPLPTGRSVTTLALS